jgi:undecaprenyl-diphosphatase
VLQSKSRALAAPNKSWWRAPLTYLAAGCFLLAYVFGRFASEVLERETGRFDRTVRSLAAAHSSPALLAVFGVITRLGQWQTLMVASFLLAAFLVHRGARVRPLLVAIAPFVGSLVLYSLKAWFHVDRPNIGSALTFSFPSGHTSGSTAVALVIAYVLRRERIGGGIWIGALLVPLFVGVSRVVLDMHWASDVVGGWLIGAAYATAVCALYELAFHRQEGKHAPHR